MGKVSKNKRIISILLVFVLLSSVLTVANASSNGILQKSAQEKYTSILKTMFLENSVAENEEIPVYIWYKDIDQVQVDNLTEAKTGLTIEKCSVIKEMPSASLLNELQQGSTTAEAQMAQYLTSTKEERNQERELSRAFSKAHREISRDKYNVKSKQLKNELSLNNKQNLFSSQYAPMIITNMTVAEITNAANNPSVEEIGYYEPVESVEPSLTQDEGVGAKQSMGLSKVYSNLGLTGNGVNVGLAEAFIPGVEADENNVPKDPSTLEVSLSDIYHC